MLNQKTIDIIKSTVPVLEIHGEKITSRFYEMMFTNHPELLNIFNHANQKQGRQQKALANTVYAAAKYIDQLEAIVPVVKQIAHKHRSLGIKPEHYPIVGKHLIMAIKDVLGDAATDEILQAWTDAYGVIADVFISVEAEMYDEAANQTGGWEDFKYFIIDKKVTESDVITSFYLKPADGKELPPFQPGQYISIKLEIEGQEYTHIRQYSLSDISGKDYYRISVKKEAGNNNPDGMVSNYLHNGLKEGERVLVSAPAGDFVLDTEKSTPVVLIGGGVGVTPMISMLNTIVEKQPERKVIFIQAAQNNKMHAFNNHVQEVANIHKNVSAHVFYDVVEAGDGAVQGYITAEWIKENALLEEADYYFCGPVPFMRSLHQSLADLGIEQSNIHFEFFGPKDEL
ncbi:MULTISPECIES: NO-inducible flavohemoprotein [unclassified Bacillus (in: firmicutes)]|uniref:NO-inducible flavohemoprotein n=1 Tax=unclassified Bacillus (in: firmicutes) TaxID=185979 RepID=UPI0008F3691C|nr:MULTISPECIES: NO-inducible flavohemoprotein [unclassified Bacillus (in: firmicutes)]SFA70889.1 nitric oxide dioxygenase [Bacillus sp. UNCCL13]SFQ60892.1 nitric oxide dioxygenase [Bacillus sp. cl95]